MENQKCPVLTTEIIKNIPLSNKTDNLTKKEKQKAWQAILEEFNAAAEEPRTLQKLKFKYHNTKTKARKSASDEKNGKKLSQTHSTDTTWMQSIIATAAQEQTSDDDFSIDNHLTKLDSNIEIVQYKPIKTEKDLIVVPINETPGEEIKPYCDHISGDCGGSGKGIQMENKAVSIPDTNHLAPKKLPEVPRYNNKAPRKHLPNKKDSTPDCAIFYKTLSKTFDKTSTEPPVENSIVKRKNPTNYEKKLYKLRARHMHELRNEEHELFQLKKRKLTLEINLLIR